MRPPVRAIGTIVAFGMLLGAATAPAQTLTAGAYRQVDPKTDKTVPYANRLELVGVAPDRLAFSVFVFRQIDNNIGSISGTIPIGATAVYVRDSPGDTRCKLGFIAGPGPNDVTVAQEVVSGDCGFGYGTDATGVYRRVPETPPPSPAPLGTPPA
jgi:hypothetical protein